MCIAMKCPRCGSTNVIVTIVNESQLVKDKPGCVWWLFIGWWWIPVKWIFFTVPARILKVFVPSKMKGNSRKTLIAHAYSIRETVFTNLASEYEATY